MGGQSFILYLTSDLPARRSLLAGTSYASHVLSIPNLFVFIICFGCRHSDFGFSARPRSRPACVPVVPNWPIQSRASFM